MDQGVSSNLAAQNGLKSVRTLRDHTKDMSCWNEASIVGRQVAGQEGVARDVQVLDRVPNQSSHQPVLCMSPLSAKQQRDMDTPTSLLSPDRSCRHTNSLQSHHTDISCMRTPGCDVQGQPEFRCVRDTIERASVGHG